MRRQFLATMQDQVERLTRLATDLLDLSRLDAGKFVVVCEPVELAEAAERIALDLTPIAHRRGATIVIETTPVMALGDETRIGQITRVLIDNAVRHNPEGVTIWVRTAQRGDATAVIVEDSGPPIPPTDAATIFSRFARGSGAGEGSGLGLAIASELADRMGGRLVLDQSGPHKLFRLELPADRPVS
jgi:signal transduction histidine kinase